ncbi:MAG: hypothetical protein GY841_12405 [FCB group bacterium]|nr:hypothetical protein [FCB group bacterium]
MIKFDVKNKEVFRGALAVPWHPKLIELYLWLLGMCEPLLITCAYEKRDYSSVHSVTPLRGFDIRSWIVGDPVHIRYMTNKTWQYDPARLDKEVCLYHDTGRGLHFHFQVHDNTVKNG